jgi:acyl carrier protein
MHLLVLAKIIEVDHEEITPETELTHEYGIKAIDVAKLVIECEKKFKIIIHDEDVHTFRSVNDIVEYIKRVQSDW